MYFKTLKEKCEYYRSLTDYKLVPNTYVLAMVDGHCFSRVIKNKFDKPFDDMFIKMMNEVIDAKVDQFCHGDNPNDWDTEGLHQALFDIIPLQLEISEDDLNQLSQAEFKQVIKEGAHKAYEMKESEFPGPEHVRELERMVLMRVIDQKWMDHLDDLEQLKQGIGLAAYGQKDPAIEYKIQAFDIFAYMVDSIKEDTIRTLFHIQVEQSVEREEVAEVTGTNKGDDQEIHKPKVRETEKVYPNDPCPCGSGKKYKHCHGRPGA